MKNIFRQTAKALLSIMVVPFMLVSCYDDSALWQSMQELESKINELKAQLDGQAEAMTALLSDGSTIKTCVKQSDGSYMLTLSNDVKFKVLAPGTNASALMSYKVIEGEKYWAIYSPSGELTPLTDKNGYIPISTNVEVDIKDGKYYIIINGQEYETGFDTEDLVQVFNSCTPLTDASGNVYAMTFDFGEGKQVTVSVDGYKGVVFKLENVGSVSKIVNEYYVPYASTQPFLIDVEGVVDYVMQIPYGWKVIERTDKQSGNVYLDITAPSKELVASGAAFDRGDLKVVAVVEGGDAVITKLVLSAEPFKKVEFSSTRLIAEPYEGVQKFVYGVIPVTLYNEAEVLETAQLLVSTSMDAPTGYAVGDADVDMTLSQIYGGELDPEGAYQLFVVSSMYQEGEEAGYYIDQTSFQSYRVGAVVVKMSDPVASLFDAEISVEVKGSLKMWAGTAVKSETLFDDIIYGIANEITEPYTEGLTYQGLASGYPVEGANDGVEFEPGVTYVTWCVPFDVTKTSYTVSDIVYKEFTTSSLVTGGTLEITAGEPVVTTSSISVPLSSEGAEAIYYAFLTNDEGKRLGEAEGLNDQKFALMQKSETFTQVRSTEVVAELEGIEPEAKMWLYSVAVDANGNLGVVKCLSATGATVQFNSISLTLDYLDLRSEWIKFKVVAEGGTPVKYIYWVGTEQDPFWIKCGKSKNIAQKYMAVYPEDDAIHSVMRAHGDFSADGEITIKGLRAEENYVMVVVAVDADGKYSKAGYKKAKTLAADLGDVAVEGSERWLAAKNTIQIDWVQEAFQPAASQAMMARYAFNISCPQDYTAFILCASDTYFEEAGVTKKTQQMIEIQNYCSRRYDDGYTPYNNGEYASEPDYYKDGELRGGQMMNVVNFYVHGLPTMGFATYFAPDSHGEGNCIYWENGQDVNYQRALELIEEYKTISKYEARAAAFGLKGQEASDWAQALLQAYLPYYEAAEPLIYVNHGEPLYMMNPYAMGINDKGELHDRVIVMLKDRQGNYFEPMYFEVPNYFVAE